MKSDHGVAGAAVASGRRGALPLAGARARVARLLLNRGPTTASAIADELGLTAAAIRRPLDDLIAEGYVVSTERPPYGPTRPRGRGRPARVYSLTPSGHEEFEKTYDDLAVDLLRFVADSAGPAGVAAFAEQRAHRLERRYADRVRSVADVTGRAVRLAQALTADGFAASVETVAGQGAGRNAGQVAGQNAGHREAQTVQICQHHCPIAKVAEEFPVLCEAEAAALGRVLGVHVVRLATLARGDGVCTLSLPGGATLVNPTTCAEVGASSGVPVGGPAGAKVGPVGRNGA